MPGTITLRVNQLDKHQRGAGWNCSELARRMGLHRTTLSRVVRGQLGVGTDFIAGALAAFPHLKFEDLFEHTP